MTRPPRSGPRVLAVSQFGAGPCGATVLADMGAEIIKIEDPASGGDTARSVAPWQLDTIGLPRCVARELSAPGGSRP